MSLMFRCASQSTPRRRARSVCFHTGIVREDARDGYLLRLERAAAGTSTNAPCWTPTPSSDLPKPKQPALAMAFGYDKAGYGKREAAVRERRLWNGRARPQTEPSLADDAFEPELAGVAKDGLAVPGDVFGEANAIAPHQQPSELGTPVVEPFLPDIGAVDR